MVAGDEDKSKYVKQDRPRIREIDNRVKFLREELGRLENLLMQKEKRNKEKNSRVILEGKKGASRTIPINQSVKSEEAAAALRKQIHDIEYCAEGYIRQIDDYEEQLLNDEEFLNKDHYEHTKRQLSITELYRHLEILEENDKNFHEESVDFTEALQNQEGIKCRKKNQLPCKVNKKGFMHCNINQKYNNRSFNDYNFNFMSDKSQLNVSPEATTTNKKVHVKKVMTCSCRELSSSSSDDSVGSVYKCSHDQVDETCDGKDDEVESVSSDEDETTCSEMSKCTCYCSKDHSHDESSDGDSDCEVKVYEEKSIMERFRGGLDNINPKTRTLVKYDNKNQKDTKIRQKTTDDVNDNSKIMKVDELREGLERLKIRNRNLRDFLDTLQNPMNLMGKSSEANTICTQVSSCYTIDVARQTRSGLLTVVEVLKGKCRNKDAVIVALADELRTGTKMDIQDVEKDKILMQDKSIIWNGLVDEDEKNNSRNFSKRDSAIGFTIFLMILISHVKRSEMISYISATKKILTESPFNLGLFINDAEGLSFDFVATYYQDFALWIQSFVKHLFTRWANIMGKTSQWFESYYEYFELHVDDGINFLVTKQSFVLPAVCAIGIVIFLMSFKKIRAISFRLRGIVKCGKICSSVQFVAELGKIVKILCLKLFSSKIFWFTLGFVSHDFWNLLHTDFYRLLDSLKMYYIRTTENSLFQNLNETQEITYNDCKLFDTFDYSWLASILCNNFQSFLEFAYNIFKNV